ncbi:MAG: hypothetical protein ACI4UN_01400, partial [Muribaculaceae bacterium]
MKSTYRRKSECTKSMVMYASARTDHEYGEDAPAGTCEVIDNLRNEGHSVRPVGRLAPIGTLAQGEQILTTHRTATGVNVLSYLGNCIHWHSAIADDGTVVVKDSLIGYVDGKVNCAQALGNMVRVGCSGGDALLRYSGGNYHLLHLQDAMPDMRITTCDADIAGANVWALDFDLGYTHWASPLSSDDEARIRAAMLSAVATIERDAHSAGRSVFPFLARYGVRLTDGSYLCVSAPVVVGCGIPFAGEYRTAVSDNGDTYTGIATFAITATTFRMGVEVMRCFSEDWDSMIAGIDILVADGVEPLQRDREVAYRCERSNVDNSALLMTRFHNLGAEELVQRLLASAKWKVRYTITDFARLREGEAVLRDADSEVAKAVVKESEASMALRHCSVALMQHNRRLFSACDEATMVSPWGASQLLNIDTSVNTTYEAAVVARIGIEGNDTVTVWHGSGKGHPTGVNALLAYPDARATAMEVQVLEGGVMKRCAVTLMGGDGIAYSVADDLLERQLVATSSSALELPQSGVAKTELVGYVLESKEMNPLVWHAAHRVCDSRITALAPDMHRSNNAIGTPVYAFADGGVYALPYRVVAASYSPGVIISRRRIAPGSAPVNTASRLAFVTDSGELCLVNQYKVERVARGLGTVVAAGYEASRDEVWLLRSNHTIAVVDKHRRVFTRSELPMAMYGQDGVELLLVDEENALLSARREQPQAATVKMLTMPFTPVPGGWFKPEAVTIDLAADLVQGSITIYGECGHSCHGMVLCRVRVDGEV